MNQEEYDTLQDWAIYLIGVFVGIGVSLMSMLIWLK